MPQEFVKGVNMDEQILLVFFAYDKEKWSNGYNFFSKLYSKYLGEEYNYVMADDSDFIKQVKQSKVIILHGGDVDKILNSLKRYPDFNSSIIGKIVVGSSAGAYALSEYGYGNDADKIFKGLGILPYRIRCHYKGEDKKIEEKFNEYPESLNYDLVILRDCEFKVFYK